MAKQVIRSSVLVGLILLAMAAWPANAENANYEDAVKLNNRGVALMGQQFTQKAARSFAAAMKADPELAQPAINEGIALLTLENLAGAKAALRKRLHSTPDNPQAWYNLGLAQHSDNELDEALKSFQASGEAGSEGRRLVLL